MGRAGDRPIDVGEGAAARLLPGPDLGWDILGAIAHDACSWGITYAADGKFDGKSARLVSSSFTCLKGWSLPMSRARAAAGRASPVSNRRLRFGNGASGSDRQSTRLNSSH